MWPVRPYWYGRVLSKRSGPCVKTTSSILRKSTGQLEAEGDMAWHTHAGASSTTRKVDEVGPAVTHLTGRRPPTFFSFEVEFCIPGSSGSGHFRRCVLASAWRSLVASDVANGRE